MSEVKPALELSPRPHALAGPAQGRTVVGERPGQLDLCLRALEYRDRLVKQAETAFTALGQARGAQRDTKSPGPAETACHLDRFLSEPPGLGRVAEQGVRNRRLGTPVIWSFALLMAAGGLGCRLRRRVGGCRDTRGLRGLWVRDLAG